MKDHHPLNSLGQIKKGQLRGKGQPRSRRLPDADLELLVYDSAPHARGTQQMGGGNIRTRRFSPACAGNTARPRMDWRAGLVQPRMRGEHGFVSPEGWRHSGSAPHARGTHITRAPGVQLKRFSPACAGNTSKAPPVAAWRPVQPRMRGEHDVQTAPGVDRYGSAPHARGTPEWADFEGVLRRFSPACAGNTGAGSVRRVWRAVQPRMRGEHNGTVDANITNAGSAPHARGTHMLAAYVLICARFSPACAGNTRSALRSHTGTAVQPRMRGEHCGWKDEGTSKLGSAPHARGTLSAPLC